MYLRRIPKLIQSYYSGYLWRVKTKEKIAYLTFDDGPTPEITDWVLNLLKQYEAKATFFLVGENVKQYPDIVHRVIDCGHFLGSHTQTHLNGWKTETKVYLKDFLQSCQTINEYSGFQTAHFRPPYGKITRAQARSILPTHEIVMMDVISGDFDLNMKGKDCFKYVKKHVRKGSIILFHDSIKAWPRLEIALPKTLEYLSEQGYRFETLPVNREVKQKLELPIV
ncbi:MAG: polysaccharide deacetylase family protein [Bacteroidetes bacterium]|nr:polysaccharide deacetylase family protein [Bacteroidota bacterium]